MEGRAEEGEKKESGCKTGRDKEGGREAEYGGLLPEAEGLRNENDNETKLLYLVSIRFNMFFEFQHSGEHQAGSRPHADKEKERRQRGGVRF